MKKLGGAFIVLVWISSSILPTRLWAEKRACVDSNGHEKIVTLHTASADQKQKVLSGIELQNSFLAACKSFGVQDQWCDQLMRPNPNPEEFKTFSWTYGSAIPLHIFIDPDQTTWKNAFRGAIFVQKLEQSGININQIVNWWRPEPYNRNVCGAPGRHPFATSIDVEFKTLSDTRRARKKLCQWFDSAQINSLGYYGNEKVHIGVGDILGPGMGETWGKVCDNL